MPIQTIPLANHIKLIHKEVASPVSHSGVLVNAGTRDEPTDKMGLAHFVEHTIFKGTTHRNGYQILRRLEDVGGDLNASTSKEETYFHASFLSGDYPRALELLSDIFFNSTFPKKELEKEKDVVLEEINYYQDTPAELIFDEFEDLVFAQHPLGRNILGNKKTVKKLQREDILQFMRESYCAQDIVLASVGNISTSKLLALCNKYFAQHQINETPKQRTPFNNYTPTTKQMHKNTYQAHILTGNTAYAITDDKRLPFTLLTNLLGGQGLNTRLNMSIREKLGLAYAVEANYSAFSDTGLFSIYIGCENSEAQHCIDLAYKEMQKLRQNKLGTIQLHKAKRQFIGQTAISCESKLNEMLAIGRSAFYDNEIETTEELYQKIEEITASELLETANEIFIPDQFSTLIYAKQHI